MMIRCYSFYWCAAVAVWMLAGLLSRCQSFTPSCQLAGNTHLATTATTMMMIQRKHATLLFNSEDSENEESSFSSSSSAKTSLEEKMKNWEATEEEVKAATLGGIVPGSRDPDRSDAFDVGLYIAFPLMVLSGLAFALFPFIMGNLDVDSVGPPPMQ